MAESVTTIDADLQRALARSICRKVRCVWFGTPIAVAIETMRLGGLTELPVMSGGYIAGVVTLSALTDAIAAAGDAVAARSAPIGQVLTDERSWRNLHTGLYVAGAATPLAEIDAYFHENPTHQVVPVIDPPGGYAGVVTRADLAACRLRTLAPARIGGMATPLGVYLTDGIHSGGAGDWGLFLSGVTLAVLGIVASLALTGLGTLASLYVHSDPMAVIAARLGGDEGRLSSELGSLILLPLVMILIRLIPLAGYHAAEHQVVHCVERGELLTVDAVKTMPRVHPRCGTNIATAVVLFSAALCIGVISWKTIVGDVMPALVLTVAFWRPMGAFVQQYFTTRPASVRQLRSGIFAAEDLLSKFRADVTAVPTVRTRIWRMGLLQTMGGVIAVSAFLSGIAYCVPALRPYVSSLF